MNEEPQLTEISGTKYGMHACRLVAGSTELGDHQKEESLLVRWARLMKT
jgi:hypothetical protein